MGIRKAIHTQKLEKARPYAADQGSFGLTRRYNVSAKNSIHAHGGAASIEYHANQTFLE